MGRGGAVEEDGWREGRGIEGGGPIKDGLSNRGLKVAGYPGPGPTHINREVNPTAAGSKAEELAKDSGATAVHRPRGLPNNWFKITVGAHETVAVLVPLVVNRVVFARLIN